ncbi:hypothetical protein NZD89_28945 (plasmid) [Alicyclobacillus fastidiosus]|uniref:Uncharacterized protein n=1 Tax=Alicyclobacillus fastidiosus TaxID=392011 RepID=A0ABY6ZQ97_9BACL|nr:hypothetical protein [Alicyclobacillus fastidiosus]WAH45012.1 hypothetical protein NZD89_28945 [Alicyclobacillus fastidiosus]GMA66290.1 hypothetical protein GCM10025859_67320 [Alicyclobacillus fastidiosus]GMA66339.1 hypothetical protein GCM10025859_67810 [Alicyclobacillus fastidiosus]
MKVLRELWSLIYDDPRLSGTVVLFLVIAVILHLTHLNILSAVAIWVGLVVALLFSVEYELRKTMNKKI